MTPTFCHVCTRDTIPPSLACTRCEDQLKTWLHEIPERYTQLDARLGAVERNPDAKIGKGTDAPAPMRLDVVDLLDERHGRHWSGLTPAEDRRGAIGTLHAHADRVRDERHLPPCDDPPTVLGEAKLLQRHLLWIAEQDWISDFHDELKQLHRQLGNAIGEHRPQPVGHCVAMLGGVICDGPLFQDDNDVRCPRCGLRWAAEDLRRFGQMLGLEAG